MTKTVTASIIIPGDKFRCLRVVRDTPRGALFAASTATASTIVSDAGESVPVTVIAQGEYEAMVDRMDDMEAAAAYHATRDEESVPAEMVAALVNGENPVRVWRKHRRLTQQALADAASIGKPYVCEIEAGKKEPSVKTLKALARVLGCDLDDLA